MSVTTIIGLLPLAVLAADSIVVLLLAAFSRRLMSAFVATLVGLVATLVFIGIAMLHVPITAGALLSFDGFVLFGFVLIVGATIFVAISSWAYLANGQDKGGEYYFLLLVASLGGCILAASSAFASFFLGLELLSVSLYALIGWRRDRGIGTEAAIKYLILAGASSAFLLFGMALVYAAIGTMDLFRLAAAATGQGILAPVGLGMMLVGIGFKLAVVPFHLWTPDIYDGAPAPVTGYIATVSKGAMVIVLARAFTPAFIGPGGTAGAASTMAGGAANGLAAGFPWVFTIIAALSMFAGNLLALREANIKRLLAYSSIAHLGYVLVAFLAGGQQALRAVAFYLVTYFVTTLGAFAVISALSPKERDADSIEDYRGLAGRRPWIAAILTTMLLSSGGAPAHSGVRREVRHPHCGSRRAALGPRRDPRSQHHDLDFLLSEGGFGDIQRAGGGGCGRRGARRSEHSLRALLSCDSASGRPGRRDPGTRRSGARGLPVAGAGLHRVVHDDWVLTTRRESNRAAGRSVWGAHGQSRIPLKCIINGVPAILVVRTMSPFFTVLASKEERHPSPMLTVSVPLVVNKSFMS